MFEWKKDFELGIGSVDADHKKLFGYANQIYDLLIIRTADDVDYDEITIVVQNLKESTKVHFKAEEDLFFKYDYPDTQEHIIEHEAFLKYLEELNIDSIIHQQKQFLKELLDKLANWVFHHMITTDYLFKEYLLKLGKSEVEA